jgi:hypothetical protein
MNRKEESKRNGVFNDKKQRNALKPSDPRVYQVLLSDQIHVDKSCSQLTQVLINKRHEELTISYKKRSKLGLFGMMHSSTQTGVITWELLMYP